MGAVRRRIAVDPRPLRHRPFRNLWLGQTISNLGGMLGSVAVLWVALLLLAVAGAADFFRGVLRSTMLMNGTPDHLRGRLAGVEFVQVASAADIGELEAGIVAALASLRASVVSGGILCIAGCLATLAFLPAYRRYDSTRPLR